MALTSLEAIAQKLDETRSSELESVLRVSGSSAVSKNEYGVTVVDEKNVASSLLFKSLTAPKYDEEEILKAIDVEVKELKPVIPERNLNLVPKPLYDEQVALVEDLRKQVQSLTAKVEALNSQIVTLKSQVQTEINNRLSVDQTNDTLVNQIDTLTGTIQDFSNQIQSAVQKSIDESILRASLQSQNTGFKAQIEALIKQIDSLNSIIEGLQAQLGAVQQQQAIQQSTTNTALASGADAINKAVILKIDGPTEDKDVKLRGNGKSGSSEVRWSTGGTLKFTNNDKAAATVKISHTKPSGIGRNPDWLIIPETQFSLPPGGTKDIQLRIDHKAGDGIDSKPGGFPLYGNSHSVSYDSTMTVSVTKADGTTESKDYKTRFGKMHPKSF
jgi:predicted  nucleic acid-binding Zn-ribbon protein